MTTAVDHCLLVWKPEFGERVKMTEYCLYRVIKTPSAGSSQLSSYKADIHECCPDTEGMAKVWLSLSLFDELPSRDQSPVYPSQNPVVEHLKIYFGS